MTLISYAQNLEDVVLYRTLRNIRNGFYVDVGANEPEFHSVTKVFYDLGWSGINIEPCKEQFQKLVNNRPRDININCAVSAKAGELEFSIIPNTGLSTALSHIADAHNQKGWNVEKRAVPAYPLKDILAPYAKKEIHFLKIDVEGMEHEVIQSVNLKQVRPWILIIEAIAPLTQTPTYQEWEPLILNASYEYVYFDGVNRYYIAAEHQELKEQLQYPPGIFDDYKRSIDIKTTQKLHQEHEEQLKTVSSRQAEAEAASATATAALAEANRRIDEMALQKNKAEAASATATAALAEANRRIDEMALEKNKAEAANATTTAALTEANHKINQLSAEKDQIESAYASASGKLRNAIEELAQSQTLYIDEKQRASQFGIALRNSNAILEKTQQLLDSKARIIELLEKDHKRKDDEIALLKATLQESQTHLYNLGVTLDAEIKRLRALLYSASVGTHIYRALHVIIGNKHYRQPNPKTPRRFKRYTSLQVPWHTHLYRAGLGIFVTGEKPWHTHLYRAFENLLGNQRYKPPRNLNPKITPSSKKTTNNAAVSAPAAPADDVPDDRNQPRAAFYSGASGLPMQKLNDAVERRMKMRKP